MSNNIIKRTWKQGGLVNIEDLRGSAFQAEDGGHTFLISGLDENGDTLALSGTPAGVLLRADGQDVTLTCSMSEGVVSATLPANAYVVPGRIGITIFLTNGGQKTAIYAAIAAVATTSSGTVAPPAGSDVVDLVNAIATAVATIPASYTDLMAAVAPTYSTSALYAVGSYAWYSGKLYRCTTAITSGETWTSAHWTQANLGSDVSDLKSAIAQNNAMYGLPKLIFGNINVSNDGTITYQTSGRYYGAITPPNVYAYFLKGTAIYLTDYTNTKFRVERVNLSTGKVIDGSDWITSGKYVVENEGNYIINIQDKSLTAKSEVDYFTRLFIVSNDMRVNALESDVESIQEDIGVNYVPTLVLGNITINSSGVATYQARSYGAITPQGQYAFFTKGTVISLSSYQLTDQVAVKFFVSYKKPDDVIFPTGSGWMESGSYEIPETGQYIINIQSSPTTNQDSASVFSDLLVVTNKSLIERVDTLETKVDAQTDGYYSLRGIKADQIINNYWPQGACAVDNDILFFAASNDAHTNYAEVSIYRLPNLMERTGYFDHNTGHAASADFAGDTNTLLLTNATYEAGVTPYIFLVGGYRAKLAAKTDIEYNGSDVAKIDLTSLEGGMACFGETGDFVYVITGDGTNYDTNITKTIYKLQIGYGTNNMVSLFPSSSIGTYSYIDANSPNGTAKIIGSWTVDFYGELQGLKYINGKLIVTTDTRKNGNIKTPFIVAIQIDESQARVTNVLWIPSISKDGSRPATEAEDIVFVNGKGYVTAYPNIYEFDERGL